MAAPLIYLEEGPLVNLGKGSQPASPSLVLTTQLSANIVNRSNLYKFAVVFYKENIKKTCSRSEPASVLGLIFYL